MNKGLIIILVVLSSCVSKYDFNVLNDKPGLVIESYFSNQSYAESLTIPSDGNYFMVELKYTSDVNNVRDVKVDGAIVTLEASNDDKWVYSAKADAPGLYYLEDKNFKAIYGLNYRLTVKLKEGQFFESSWESLPEAENLMGDFSFEEVDVEKYKWEVGEEVIVEISGINVALELPRRKDTEGYNFKWSFEPLWQHSATDANSQSPVKTCWVRSPYYQNDFVLGKGNNGDSFTKDLFFLETKGNDRLFQYFSTVVYQDILSPEHAVFWEDYKAQGEKGGLFDQPPYGLGSNFICTNDDWTANGYFGVLSRKAQRWTFEPKELSYVIYNYWNDVCAALPGGQCSDCREYSSGDATITKPHWWWDN